MQKTADFIHEDHWTETNSDEFIRYGHLFFPQDAKVNSLITRLIESGGAKLVHGSGGIVPPRAA